MAGCPMGRWSPTWRARFASCANWATVPSGASADTDSCVTGTGLRLNPQLGRIPAEMGAELTSAEIAMSGSYFDDVLRDVRRYGIENTTDKECRPGAVPRRRDAVCTERIVGHPEAIYMNVQSLHADVPTPISRESVQARRPAIVVSVRSSSSYYRPSAARGSVLLVRQTQASPVDAKHGRLRDQGV
jgi:hypothetical protein